MQEKKKVIVVGGGIAGLSAGVYAQKCGFDVTVLESHAIAGGNCTSWRRGGYLFEGGMHWLSGSDPKNSCNKMWRHIGALNDGVQIRCLEPFMELDCNGAPVRLFRDVEKTEKHLLEISPADSKEIRRLCGWIRKLNGLDMPISDIRGVKTTRKSRMPLSSLLALPSMLLVIGAVSRIKRNEYINRFKHEGIRDLLRAFTFEQSGLFPMVFTMGALTRGDGGFPHGGSLPFVERVVKTFTDLGGEILYKTRADRVIIENGKVSGVSVLDKAQGASRVLEAAAVIITADTMAIDNLFDAPPKAKWLDEMRANTEPTMATFVSIGIAADLKKYHYYYAFRLKTPIKLANETYEFINVSNYAADPVYSPSGKSAVTVQLSGDTYGFWKKAKEENRYDEEKKRIGEAVSAAIEAQIPETSGKIEVIDIATPLTYERYCGNWKGSWMTEMKQGMKIKTYPATIDGLCGCYFAGHRLMPPGGLPAALVTARTAVQHLCRDTETVFVAEGR